MVHARAWIALALLTLPALAGCLADVERVRVGTGWEADATLYEGPAAGPDERPAQLIVSGTIEIGNASSVELTGVEGSLEGPNRSVPMQPVRLRLGDRALDAPAAASENLELTTGDTVELSMLPARAGDVRLTQAEWNATAELSYRYRDGPRFDAGHISFQANLTTADLPSLGVGVTRANDEGGVSSLVFEDLAGNTSTGETTVGVLHVGDDGARWEGNRSAEIIQGEGVVIVELAEPYAVPEGSGYTLFQLATDGNRGVAAQPDEATEEALPAPSALAVVAAIALGALVLRRRA